MIFDAVYYRERARRAVAELAELRVKYDATITRLRRQQDRYERLSATFQETLNYYQDSLDREQVLADRVADLEQHVECMTIDVVEMEKVVAAMTDGLRWFEKAEDAK